MRKTVACEGGVCDAKLSRAGAADPPATALAAHVSHRKHCPARERKSCVTASNSGATGSATHTAAAKVATGSSRLPPQPNSPGARAGERWLEELGVRLRMGSETRASRDEHDVRARAVGDCSAGGVYI
jgi:hypothetical protein